MERMKRRLKIRNLLVRECMSEFLGTFILIMFGCGAMAQMKTSRGLKGQYLSVNIAFAVAVMVAMYLSRGISGAHLNPALSLSCCVLGKLAWSRLLPYSFSQLLGAYAGASVVFLMYYDAIMDYSGGALTVLGPNETASIFATYPSSFLSLGSSFFDQMIGTGMIMLCYLPLVDHHNSPAPQDLVPLLVGVVFMGVSMSMFSNCGGGMNPARDLGPRLFMLSAGWGAEVFTCNNYWFWVPIVAPLVGAILGSWVYLIFIQWHLPDPEQDEPGNDLRLATIMQNGVELAQRF